MNSNTKEDLKRFIESVERLAHGCVHMIGVEGVRDVLENSERLKQSLDKDETIP